MTAAVATADRTNSGSRLRRIAPPVLVVGGVVLAGAVSVAASLGSPGLTLSGDGPIAAGVVLAAGWSLVAVGLETVRRGRERFGWLLSIAGVLWFTPDWAVPGVGSPVAFTIGLLAGAIGVAVIAHALIVSDPSGRARGWGRGAIVLGYVIFGIFLGVVPSVTFSTELNLCAQCPDNLLALAPSESLRQASIRLGRSLTIGWVVIVVGSLGVRFFRAGAAARRLQAPYLTAGAAYLAVVATGALRSALASPPLTDPALHLIRLCQAIALLAVAGGVALEWLQVRSARVRVARLVADLGHTPAPLGLRDALATLLGDVDLRIGYPVETDRFVDATGAVLALEAAPGRRMTPLIRDGETVAVLDHRSDVLEQPSEIDEVVRAARLGLEHERLQAEARARLGELTRSRQRIVAAGDVARRQLERDLHDGAQQRLVALSMGLRLVEATPGSRTLIDDASREVAVALDELRDVAHGLFPRVLEDEGLRAAVEGLAEGSPTGIRIVDLPDERFDRAVEAAAYLAIAEAARATGHEVRVEASREDDRLILRIEASSPIAEVVEPIADRVGAAGGQVRIAELPAGKHVLHLELPCES